MGFCCTARTAQGCRTALVGCRTALQDCHGVCEGCQVEVVEPGPHLLLLLLLWVVGVD
jgi:hypothetical protein